MYTSVDMSGGYPRYILLYQSSFERCKRRIWSGTGVKHPRHPLPESEVKVGLVDIVDCELLLSMGGEGGFLERQLGLVGLIYYFRHIVEARLEALNAS